MHLYRIVVFLLLAAMTAATVGCGATEADEALVRLEQRIDDLEALQAEDREAVADMDAAHTFQMQKLAYAFQDAIRYARRKEAEDDEE